MNTGNIRYKSLIIGAAVIIAVIAILAVSGRFYYILKTVEQQEVGVQFQGGRIVNVVGPGVYSDFGLFVSMVTISGQAVPFEVTDPEIITSDKQRIGLVVSGDIFRPDASKRDIIREKWSQYRGVYLDDQLTINRVSDLTKQSMKVCVGDRTFDDNIIGTSRDALRACIDDELNDLAAQLGLEVKNVVVPEVVLSPEVQVALDAIVQSRLETEKAAQDKLKAEAEASAEQARQEGEIRVEQSRIQEQTRQQTILAVLEQERLAAQKAIIEAERVNDLAKLETQLVVIESTKANELLSAERDLIINEVLAEAAVEKAKAELAYTLALAELYNTNPEYLQLQIIQANASALQPTDKIIFTPEGTTPTIVLPGPGIVPTVETNPETELPATP
jgi:hypothetical protein